MMYDPDTAAVIRQRLAITQRLNPARISAATWARLRLELVPLAELFKSRSLAGVPAP